LFIFGQKHITQGKKRTQYKQVQKQKHWPGRRYSYANYSAPLVKHRKKQKTKKKQITDKKV